MRRWVYSVSLSKIQTPTGKVRTTYSRTSNTWREIVILYRQRESPRRIRAERMTVELPSQVNVQNLH